MNLLGLLGGIWGKVGSFSLQSICIGMNDLVLSKRAPMDLEISTAYLQIQVAGS